MKKAGSLLLIACFLLSIFTGALLPLKVGAISENNERCLDLSSIRKVYVSDDNCGYNSTEEGQLPFSPLTQLKVKTNNDAECNFSFDENGMPVVAVQNAQKLSVSLHTPNLTSDDPINNTWSLSSDPWGDTSTGNEAQGVTGASGTVVMGSIGSGGLVIEKSFDNRVYSQQQLDRFENQLYTSDYLDNFHNTDKDIFVPDGNDVKRGVYISVNFYYEIKKFVRTEKYYTTSQIAVMALSWIGAIVEAARGPQGRRDIYEYKNVRESYVFKLVEDDPGGVTFNNLTTHDNSEIIEVAQPSSNDPEEYAAQSEQYNQFVSSVLDQVLPTMYDGDMTTTGFRINVTSNPYLTVNLKRNGVACPLSTLINKNSQWYYEITMPGRYDITVSSYSRSKTITLFVDNDSGNVAYQRYFGGPVFFGGEQYGDEFLNYSPDNPYGNIRVYDPNSSVPVFAGKLTLKLKETDSNYLPLYGVITNQSTGITVSVDSPIIVLEELGEYEILFFTNKDYYNYAILGESGYSIAGDVRVFRFHFKLIGTPKKSTVNRQLLSTRSYNDFSIVSPSDYIPKFWGVSRTSADKGRIIVAFADEASALQYATSVAIGDIERIDDDQTGRTYWLVPNPENPMQKVRSDSGWNTARLIKEVSSKMVNTYFFDLTDSSSFLTLDKTALEYQAENGDITQINLATLHLSQTVVIWFDSIQRVNAMAKTDQIELPNVQVLTFIGRSRISVLQEHEGKCSVLEEDRDYCFIKDSLGIDSNRITVVDSLNNSFNLNYNEGFYAQLMDFNCAPGLVRIVEETVYGFSSEYFVCYIPEEYQPAEIFIVSGDGTPIAPGGVCRICRVTDISNLIDPYSFVQVYYRFGGEAKVSNYSTNDIKDITFDAQGNYEISIIDRFGNSRTIDFVIQ